MAGQEIEEPKRLKDGKKFHKQVQDEWDLEAEGEVLPEETVDLVNGKKGRMDISVQSDDELVAVVEIKNSDWDAMTERNLKRNVRSQIRQVWKYIESQIEMGKDVSPGIIFPKRPSDIERLKLIESMFLEEGIPVVWQDESKEEVEIRMKGNQ